MPHVGNILETSLYVEDVARSAEFYARLFGLETLYSGERLWALGVGTQVLLIFDGGTAKEPVETPGGLIPGHGSSGRQHLAFAVDGGDLGAWRETLSRVGVPIESEVCWPRGGRSIYFRDPDGHSIELVTPGTWPNY
jgi:catechol 2,3-dioxygenase-like lactoylglutathione lyase family enzyme